MRLSYAQLNFVVDVLREAKRDAHLCWQRSMDEVDTARAFYDSWYKQNPDASKEEKALTFKDHTSVPLQNEVEAREAYEFANAVYTKFVDEGVFEI